MVGLILPLFLKGTASNFTEDLKCPGRQQQRQRKGGICGKITGFTFFILEEKNDVSNTINLLQFCFKTISLFCALIFKTCYPTISSFYFEILYLMFVLYGLIMLH
jgi:hypothetical protein